MDKSPKVRTELRRLHAYMDEMLSTQSSQSHKLLRLIERWLRQFNLHSRLSSSEILVEAYLRTHAKVLDGLVVDHFPAWFNRMAFRLIQEHSRRRKYHALLQQRLQRSGQPMSTEMPLPAEGECLGVEALLKSLEELDEEESALLNLRVVQGLSWKQVHEQWKTLTGQTVSVAALRKRGERALARLRAAFESHAVAG